MGQMFHSCQLEIRMRAVLRARLIVAIFVFMAGCGGTSVNVVSTVQFSPNPATLAGRVCTSEVQLISLSSSSVNVITLDALFRDSQGREAQLSFDVEALRDRFPTLTVPGAGTLSGTFEFDFSGTELQPPMVGTVVLIGEGSGITQFVGSLTCEEA